jgi:hypothetical protein
MLKVETPYNQAFVAALKESIPWQDRDWSDTFHKAWAVDPRHADAVRSLMTEHFGDFEDYTDTTPEETARQRYQAAVEDTLRALRGMPRATFNVVAVLPGVVEVQPKSHLGKQHFNALQDAALHSDKRAVGGMVGANAVDHREAGWYFDLVCSPKVLDALARHHCMHLDVVDDESAEITEHFDEGVIHLEVESEFRVGVRARRVATDSVDRTMLLLDNAAYYVLDPAQCAHQLLLTPALKHSWRLFLPRAARRYWKRHIDKAGIPLKTPDTPDWALRLDLFAQHFHLLNWVKDWVKGEAEAPVEITGFHEGDFPGWRYRQPDGSLDLTGQEPGRHLLTALGATADAEDAPKRILEGIGWTHEDVKRLYAERQRMIREAQEAYIAKRRENAEGIARQRLEERTKAELAEMAEGYAVHVAQSWRKAEQINALLDSPEVVKDVAGIAQMREHLEYD